MITHYTSDIGLRNIIENHKIWFTDIEYLNDYNEKQLLFDEMIKICLQEISKISDISDMELVKIKDMLLGITKNSKYRNFIFCTSLNGDSLPMWNYYSKGSDCGFGISFDEKRLVDSILSNQEELKPLYYLYSGDVIYDKDIREQNILQILSFCESLFSCLMSFVSKDILAKIIRFVIEIIINNIKDEQQILELKDILLKDNDSLFEIIKDSVSKEQKEEIKLKTNIINHSINIPNVFYPLELFSKDEKFNYEKEHRLVISIKKEMIPLFKKIGVYKMRNSHGMIIPYLDISIDIKSIKDIKISPLTKNIYLEKNLELFLDDNNISPTLTASDITVRF